MIRLLVCIDDTDNLDSIGTGEIADQIAMMVRKQAWGVASRVTRHQLFIHEDIPYTSHNSSMCFEATVDEDRLDEFNSFCQRHLVKFHADGSDPGLCIVNLNDFTAENELIEFGQKAKKMVLTKEEAYQFARDNGIHLTEHGGTGQGVIGALAGCGLRLSGNDGRFRGKRKLPHPVMSVEEILKDEHIDQVRTENGTVLPLQTLIDVTGNAKTVFLDHQSVLLVQEKSPDENQAGWELISKEKLKKY
ncbi:MAG: hypothetical protein Q8935_04870 [Bacillota bacterium]|nr:hypothetical protein [Bacillota bacterium]